MLPAALRGAGTADRALRAGRLRDRAAGGPGPPAGADRRRRHLRKPRPRGDGTADDVHRGAAGRPLPGRGPRGAAGGGERRPAAGAGLPRRGQGHHLHGALPRTRRGPTTPAATWRHRSCPSSSAPGWPGASAGWCSRCDRRWRSTRARRCGALRGRKRIDELLYVGDDRTDLDAFREATIKIAVRSAEAPPELIEPADAVVDGPTQVVELLDSLWPSTA